MNVPPHLSQQMRFNGRWCAEFEIERRDIPLGISSTENRRGRTSHESFPGLVCLEASATEDQGTCLGLHLGWSGNHRVVLERKSFGLTQAQLGLLPLAGELRLRLGESIATPELYAAMSDRGLNGVSQAFHAYIRANVIRWPAPATPRPVTANTWEALYFDHDLNRLKGLADAAADIGVERFVLDDGWFKGRSDDTRALGDWTPDPETYPDGLHPIVDFVVDEKGMQFGLWVEPEMVNADSELYRAHPDWALKLGAYPHVLGRNQMVLDLTNDEVSRYLFERLSDLLATYRISYLKWDMNRDLVLAGDQKRRPAGSRQTRALYSLIDRVRSAFPHVEIESCASGGARVDFEILKRTHRFWPSDSNDPVERARIQAGFSHFFPPEVMGSHIGPTWSHTSGRGCTPEFRALTAGAGHFGFECDLATISEEDRAVFAAAVARYKADRDIWHSGRLWRLTTGDPDLIATAASSTDQRRVRVFALQIDRARSVAPVPLRIPGLDPAATYRVRLTSGPPPERSGTRRFENPLSGDGFETTGEVLARAGVQLPVLYAQSGVALAIDAVTDSA
ncbi:MAG: alpha-galactosidase, partial [Pseudomonadota bacterium]